MNKGHPNSCRCGVLIDRNDLPKHLFGIPGLDVSDDLSGERLAGPWLMLGRKGTGPPGSGSPFSDMLVAPTLRDNAPLVSRSSMLLHRSPGDHQVSGRWLPRRCSPPHVPAWWYLGSEQSTAFGPAAMRARPARVSPSSVSRWRSAGQPGPDCPSGPLL